MSNTPINPAARFVEAFPKHVESRIVEQGWERLETLDAALETGAVWLRQALNDLLATPFAEQRRGPLELFQEAMRFPTEALAVAGVEAVARDPGAVAALPGDVYNLAPASSRLLGDEVWMAHLAWGAAKARAVARRRRVGLWSTNLMDRSKIEPLVVGYDAEFVVWNGRSREPTQPATSDVDLVLVDLTAPHALDVIEGFVADETRVIAFGPHLDRSNLDRARQAGANEVLARSAFFENLGDLLS